MYNLDKIENSMSRGKVLRKYSEEVTDFFRLNSRDKKTISDQVKGFAKGLLQKYGAEGYVLSLDYGLNSLVTAKLLSDAVGPGRVYGVLLTADQKYFNNVQKLREELEFNIYSPRNFGKKFETILSSYEQLNIDNKHSDIEAMLLQQVRLVTIKDISIKNDLLVSGCSSATERMLDIDDYNRMSRDSDVEILHDLFKTTVDNLSYMLDFPVSVLDVIKENNPTRPRIINDIGWQELDIILLGYELNLVDKLISEVSGLDIDIVKDIKQEIETNKVNKGDPKYPEFFK